jgi:hypothetical protein
MAQQATNQTVTAPVDLLQSLLNSVNSLRDEVSLLRNEAKDSLAAVLASISPPTPRGAFSLFPKLVPEIRHMIWDAALYTPRIVGAKFVHPKGGGCPEALTPTAPNSSILFVNKESRARAKKVLACVTAKETSSRGRIPLLYINPAVDTLWVPKCTWGAWACALNGSVAALLGKLMIRKVAIPFETWAGMFDNPHEYENAMRFLIELRENGIERVVVALGDEDAAERLDPVFIKPKEIPAFCLDHYLIQEISYMYLDRGREGKRISCPYWANQRIEDARDWYMEDVGITKSPTDSSNETYNVMVQWCLEKWEPPRFKFMEATTRKQLGELKKFSDGKGYGGIRQ